MYMLIAGDAFVANLFVESLIIKNQKSKNKIYL